MGANEITCPEGHNRYETRPGASGAPGEFELVGLLKHLKSILDEKDPDKMKELIFGPTTWGLWMHMQYGAGPSRCNACITLCPVGWKGQRTPVAF